MSHQTNKHHVLWLFLLLVMAWVKPAEATVNIQCPCPPGSPISAETGNIECTIGAKNVLCKSLTAGDGFINMADKIVNAPDGRLIYIFGFKDVTGVPEDMVMDTGMLGAQFSGPRIVIDEGKDFYLSLTNVGMQVRPDLFDPHTVHFHGYQNASSVFDGEPMSSISINMGSTLTYFYRAPEPGTYMYHCHVEATEHMQMGMLGNLYVRPKQDGTAVGGCSSMKYVFNDGDGTTCYDKDYPVQIESFDPVFHDADQYIQPLPFAAMADLYPMLNGRGYPDTINPAVFSNTFTGFTTGGKVSQKENTIITATAGQKILLRISSLSTVEFHGLRVLGIPMKVVGKDARILRSSSGQNLYYGTASVHLGGGQSWDVILDTTGVPPGTYPLYVTNLEDLSNDQEDFGGMMTEIVIN